LKNIITIFSALFLLISSKPGLLSASVVSLTYHAYSNENTIDKVIGETFVTIKDISDDQTVFNRQKQTKNCMIKDEFILDGEYSLKSWTRICVEGDTEYTSVRKGGVLAVQGRKNGEIIDKEIELGDKALHIYPKYSLSKFALSGMPQMKFWALRRDKMTKHPMQAIRKGIETITINDKEVEAIKVYYSITGKLREKHFNHNYYFRKSDGQFLKKEENNGRVEVLVLEE